MPKTKYLFLILLPAILIVAIALLINIWEYEPLYPKQADNEQNLQQNLLVPLFPEDPIVGNKKAPLAIVVFGDLSCGACAQQAKMFDDLLKKYEDKIKIIWKLLPVTQFPYNTENAHKYAYCANQQNKFIEFKNYAFANKDNLSQYTLDAIAEQIELDKEDLKKCIESKNTEQYIKNLKAVAQLLNIQSVPTIFIQNKQVQPQTSVERWEVYLNL